MTKSCFPVSDTLSAEASPADDVVGSLYNKKDCYRIVVPNLILYIEFGSGSRILAHFGSGSGPSNTFLNFLKKLRRKKIASWVFEC